MCKCACDLGKMVNESFVKSVVMSNENSVNLALHSLYMCTYLMVCVCVCLLMLSLQQERSVIGD